MFQLVTQRATLTSVNPRAEKHGDSNVPAVDLQIQFDSANDILHDLGPKLRESFFFKDSKTVASPAAQGELETVEPVSELPDLRNPQIEGAIKLSFSGVGYTIEIDFGIGGMSNLVLEDVAVNGVKMLPKQGGTVQMTMRIQSTEPEASTMGALCQMIGNNIIVTLTPPETTHPQRSVGDEDEDEREAAEEDA